MATLSRAQDRPGGDDDAAHPPRCVLAFFYVFVGGVVPSVAAVAVGTPGLVGRNVNSLIAVPSFRTVARACRRSFSAVVLSPSVSGTLLVSRRWTLANSRPATSALSSRVMRVMLSLGEGVGWRVWEGWLLTRHLRRRVGSGRPHTTLGRGDRIAQTRDGMRLCLGGVLTCTSGHLLARPLRSTITEPFSPPSSVSPAIA